MQATHDRETQCLDVLAELDILDTRRELALVVLYFYLGWKVVGGMLWQRILGAR
ncbi:hypothetical protein ACVW1C_000046 [Bradyrhizobium sp. USDA 4011]